MTRDRRDEYTKALEAIPLFADLSKKELQFLAGVTTETSVHEGSILVKQGEPGQEAMVVESGTGSIRRDGTEIDTIGPGDFFGEMSLVVNQPRNADVVATSDMTLLVMGSREFSSVLAKYPEVAVTILKTRGPVSMKGPSSSHCAICKSTQIGPTAITGRQISPRVTTWSGTTQQLWLGQRDPSNSTMAISRQSDTRQQLLPS